jgi:uncharacterized protein (DUF1800 family)
MLLTKLIRNKLFFFTLFSPNSMKPIVFSHNGTRARMFTFANEYPSTPKQPNSTYFLTLGVIALLFSAIALVVVSANAQTTPSSAMFPYKKSGMTDRQAAAYLLDRFTFGARPNDVDALLQQGLESWFQEQLQGKLPETTVLERLAQFSTLTMTNEEIVRTFPQAGLLLRQAMQDGVISQNDRANMDKADYRQELRKYAVSKGYKPKRELYGEMFAQKLLRALYSPNQLQEVMTDFWFNHFSVSITDNQADQYVMTYERDAIRPNALGTFRTLVGATAKHPAMLAYLDNAQSTAPDGTPTTLSMRLDSAKNQGGSGMGGAFRRKAIEAAQKRGQMLRDSALQQVPEQFRPRKGINENYARELMELHTLGVDGGYAQRDVTEAARILTGWTIYPKGAMLNEKRAAKLQEWLERGQMLGFVQEGDFLFRADAHDATEKTFLGVKFAAGGGMNEGEQLLDMLSAHPSTATFICTKIARRFVDDTPPTTLVQRMATRFIETKGDIRAVLLTMAYSDEFWKEKDKGQMKNATTQATKHQVTKPQATNNPAPTNRTKIKSPFELAISALRALNADVQRPREVLEWIRKIGQPLYAYQAPTGFPDRAESWINTGSLLNRMNFGLNLALGNIRGVSFDIAGLNQHHEPQSLQDALQTYVALLLPERNHDETVRLLTPVLADPDFAQKVQNAAQRDSSQQKASETQVMKPQRKQNTRENTPQEADIDWEEQPLEKQTLEKGLPPKPQHVQTSALAQVVGIILGSPEFQRR